MIFGDPTYLPVARKLCLGPARAKGLDEHFVRSLALCIDIWQNRDSATSPTYIQFQMGIVVLLLESETDRRILAALVAGFVDPSIPAEDIFNDLVRIQEG